MSGGLKLNEVFDNQPSPDPIETRWYIGVSDLGRMVAKFGPDRASGFKLGPRETFTLDDGTVLFPVSEAVCKAFDEHALLDEDADGDSADED